MLLVKAAASASASAAAAAAMAAAPAPQSFCSPRLPPSRLHSSSSSSSSSVSPSFLRLAPCSSSLPLRVSASSAETPEAAALTGVVFEPFLEVQDQLVKVSPSRSVSLARHCYAESSEAAVNEQINIEYSASYFYHTLFAYFDRDNVALPGLAKFFKESSDEERDHAEKLIKYQNMRGGKVKLQTILAPTQTEFDDEEKGDALYAMELTLAMEKLVNEKLLHLHRVADEAGDAQLTDFIEGEFLKSQVEDIKKIAEYVSQLRRVGKGHGVYHFDLQLQ